MPSYLLTWNGNKSRWTDYQECLDELRSSRFVKGDWSISYDEFSSLDPRSSCSVKVKNLGV